MIRKRFNNGKDEYDFTKPCKLTRQKRLVEAQKEFVRLEHKALRFYSITVIISDCLSEDKSSTLFRIVLCGSIAQQVYGTCLSRKNNTGSNPVGVVLYIGSVV